MRSANDAERGMAAPETLGLDTRVEIRKAAIRLLEEMLGCTVEVSVAQAQGLRMVA